MCCHRPEEKGLPGACQHPACRYGGASKEFHRSVDDFLEKDNMSTSIWCRCRAVLLCTSKRSRLSISNCGQLSQSLRGDELSSKHRVGASYSANSGPRKSVRSRALITVKGGFGFARSRSSIAANGIRITPIGISLCLQSDGTLSRRLSSEDQRAEMNTGKAGSVAPVV